MLKFVLFIVLVLICRFASADDGFRTWVKSTITHNNFIIDESAPTQFSAGNNSGEVKITVLVEPNDQIPVTPVKILHIEGLASMDPVINPVVLAALQAAHQNTAGLHVLTLNQETSNSDSLNFQVLLSSETQSSSGIVNLL